MVWYDAHIKNAQYVPDMWRDFFPVQQSVKHGVQVKMTDKYVEFYHSNALPADESWTNDTYYVISMRIVIPVCFAEISFTTESQRK